jgi:hypothetical protein
LALLVPQRTRDPQYLVKLIVESQFGWTHIARSDVAKAAELLRGGERGVRDEIGFLSLHQGFADRFFPGTSVLQTRLRYVLFVPWQIQDLEAKARSGVSSAEQLRTSERRLVARLRGGGIIGIRSDRGEAAQPPSVIYWTALRLWGILNPYGSNHWPSRDEIVTRIDRGSEWTEDEDSAVSDNTFYALPAPPPRWSGNQRLDFRVTGKERKYLTERLELTKRIEPDTKQQQSLLGRLAACRKCPTSWRRVSYDSPIVRNLADDADREALKAAAATAALAHIGRAVYSALVEGMAAKDGRRTTDVYGAALRRIVSQRRDSALALNLNELERWIGPLDPKLHAALSATQSWTRARSTDVFALWKPYCEAEERRKGRRSRLLKTPHAEALRGAWLASAPPEAEPLNYRWHRVSQLLDDLHGIAG